MIIDVDIETFSGTDIKAGVYRYIEDPLFEIMMCAIWPEDEDEPRLLIGETQILMWFWDAWDAGHTFSAHNAGGFERPCFSVIYGETLDPERFIDPMVLAAEHGYPQGLNNLAKALGVEEKDSAGTRLINLFCKPQRGRRIWPHDKPEQWEQFMDYCLQDVRTLRAVREKLPDWPSEMERQIYNIDQRINDRGMKIDMELAAAAVEAAADNHLTHSDEIFRLTGVLNPNSIQQLLPWLQQHGCNIKNLQADTVTKALQTKQSEDVRRVLELRQELALIASKKFTAALNSTCADGRFRGGFRFFGAHTGRWAGQGIQPHNFPRESFADDEGDYDFEAEARVIDSLKSGNGATSLELKRAVRPMILGPMTVVDYVSVEAGVIAWLAGEQWTLDALQDERDIYVETADRMGGLTRFQGKIAVLALGFGGGIRSLKALAGDREALLELAKPPSMVPGGGVRSLTSDVDIDRGLQRLVDEWRDANPNIVRLWKRIEQKIRNGGRVNERLTIRRSGEDMWLDLPSGRSIVYHGLRWERYRAMRNGKWKMEEGWRYDDPKKVGLRIPTYGGRLAENATQAVARDILAESLVRLEEHGYPVVLHVHDEIVVESDAVDEIAKIMCEPPSWADGLPIAAKGFLTERYRKD